MSNIDLCYKCKNVGYDCFCNGYCKLTKEKVITDAGCSISQCSDYEYNEEYDKDDTL